MSNSNQSNPKLDIPNRILLAEIEKLPVADEITQITRSNSVMEWLETLKLRKYLSKFQEHGFQMIKDVTDISDSQLTNVGLLSKRLYYFK